MVLTEAEKRVERKVEEMTDMMVHPEVVLTDELMAGQKAVYWVEQWVENKVDWKVDWMV